MRSLSLVVLLVVALYLVSHSAGGDVSLNLNVATARTYNDFIENVRKVLKSDSKPVFNIPVLRKTASGTAGYLSVHLTSNYENTITLGINVVNVYVLAYEVGNEAYYLNDSSDAYKYLFNNSTRNVLKYGSSYSNLLDAANAIRGRENVPLGFKEMGIAIDNMFYKKDSKLVAKGFIVLIQAVSEASRFKYIQKKFSANVYSTFLPDGKFLDLENNWSSLSKQILIAESNNGQFKSPVTIDGVKVTNVSSPIVKEMGLLLTTKATLVYDDDILLMPNDRDTASVTNTAAAIAMETASYRYSYTNRKSFLNPAREAIAAM